MRSEPVEEVEFIYWWDVYRLLEGVEEAGPGGVSTVEDAARESAREALHAIEPMEVVAWAELIRIVVNPNLPFEEWRRSFVGGAVRGAHRTISWYTSEDLGCLR